MRIIILPNFQMTTLLAIWVPFWLNEYTIFMDEIENHFKLKIKSAKSYFSLSNTIIIKLMYISCFQALYWKRTHLTNMINQISKLDLVMKQYGPKSRISVNYFLQIHIILLFLDQVAMYVLWLAEVLATDKLVYNFCNIFVKRGRRRFLMQISSDLCTIKPVDCIIGFYELWLLNISNVIWITTFIIYAALVPLTLWITVKYFKERLFFTL